MGTNNTGEGKKKLCDEFVWEGVCGLAHRDFRLQEIFHRQGHATEHLREEQRLRGGIENCGARERIGFVSVQIEDGNKKLGLGSSLHIHRSTVQQEGYFQPNFLNAGGCVIMIAYLL